MAPWPSRLLGQLVILQRQVYDVRAVPAERIEDKEAGRPLAAADQLAQPFGGRVVQVIRIRHDLFG
jgi:hypothetical protein